MSRTTRVVHARSNEHIYVKRSNGGSGSGSGLGALILIGGGGWFVVTFWVYIVIGILIFLAWKYREPLTPVAVMLGQGIVMLVCATVSVTAAILWGIGCFLGRASQAAATRLQESRHGNNHSTQSAKPHAP